MEFYGVNLMNPTPQAVTERYVSNLITNGRNKEFDVNTIVQRTHHVEGEPCGVYFTAVIDYQKVSRDAHGATVSQAVRRALEKHGVTFR